MYLPMTRDEIITGDYSSEEKRKFIWIFKIYFQIVAASSSGLSSTSFYFQPDDINLICDLATYFNEKGFKVSSRIVYFSHSSNLLLSVDWSTN